MKCAQENRIDVKITGPSTGLCDRRSSIRVEAEIRVFYGVGGSKLLGGYSIDLSSDGVFLAFSCPFEVGDRVHVRLYVGEEQRVISCYARVAWLNHENKPLKADFPCGAGLQFLDLSKEDKEFLVNYLD